MGNLKLGKIETFAKVLNVFAEQNNVGLVVALLPTTRKFKNPNSFYPGLLGSNVIVRLLHRFDQRAPPKLHKKHKHGIIIL